MYYMHIEVIQLKGGDFRPQASIDLSINPTTSIFKYDISYQGGRQLLDM